MSGTCRMARSSAELEEASRRLSPGILLRVLPTHPDHLNRSYLGTASEETFRLYFLLQRRNLVFLCCHAKDTQRRERLWGEMMRIKTLLNASLGQQIRDFHSYPPDTIFIDSNREVYAISAPWTPVEDAYLHQGGWLLGTVASPADLVIERHQESDGINS